MKATQTKREEPVMGGRCCICGQTIIAPWGRNGPDGEDWVCRSACQESYNRRKGVYRESDESISGTPEVHSDG